MEIVDINKLVGYLLFLLVFSVLLWFLLNLVFSVPFWIAVIVVALFRHIFIPSVR